MKTTLPIFFLTLLTLGAAAPADPAITERQTTIARGFCILATNTCNTTTPTDLAGLMTNCAAGAGLDGTIGRGQHNCTIDHNPCHWPVAFGGGVFCDDPPA